MPKLVLPAKRRRKGFESVRKGYRSADARLMFFENGLLYCKLTVASDIKKGLVHVSFGAVGNYCRGMLKKAFLFRFALHELKKTPLSRIKKIFISRNFTNFTQNHFFTHKNFFCTCLSSLSAKISIFTNQKLFFRTNLYELPSKAAFFTYKKPFIRTNLSLIPTQNNSFLPSASHSHHP